VQTTDTSQVVHTGVSTWHQLLYPTTVKGNNGNGKKGNGKKRQRKIWLPENWATVKFGNEK